MTALSLVWLSHQGAVKGIPWLQVGSKGIQRPRCYQQQQRYHIPVE
jgi:hypothetical protein